MQHVNQSDEVCTSLTLFLIVAHIAAALWHKRVRRDGVWESIGTPWWSRFDTAFGWAKGKAGP